MVSSKRFDHQTAIAAAMKLRNALRFHRWHLAVRSVFAPAPKRAEIERAVDHLHRRESALQGFLENPYGENSIFDMRANDRTVLMDAGTAERGGKPGG